MKLFPIITSILVITLLFFAVLQRDALIDFADRMAGGEEVPVETATAPAPEPEAPVVEASTVVHVIARQSVAQNVADGVIVRGETQPLREVRVSAETQGTVISEPIRRGAAVDAGDLLCALDPGTREATLLETQARLAEAEAQMPSARARVPEAQARVSEAEARVTEAEINETAARQLSRDGFASTTRLANAEAALRAAQAALVAAETGLESAKAGIDSVAASIQSAKAAEKRAQDDLKKLELRAPFAGVLETDTAELGALLQPGALCGTVIQLNPVKFVGFVSEADVGRVKVGARAIGRVVTGTEVIGEVAFLSRAADELTRTFQVEIIVENPDLSIRSGQTVEIIIETAEASGHFLPASALTLNNEGVLGVRVVEEDSTVGFTPIRLLRDTSEGIWVDGLPDEAQVILVGQEYVTEGSPVEVSFEELTQ